jgi:branched-chain amino acid aminotransferase
LTGTAAEIVPVVKVDGRAIGNSRPGALTLKLMKKFKELTRKEGVRY